MCGVTGAIIGAGVLGAGAAIYGSGQQADAADRAADMSMEQYNRMREDQRPYVQSGYAAQTRLNDLMGLSAPQQSQPLAYQDWAQQNPGQIGQGYGGIAGLDLGQIGYQQYLANYQPTATGERPSDFGSLMQPFGAAEFNQYKDPGYNFRLQQGTQGLQNSAAAGSGALSGAALKDLIGYNQDMASTEYGNSFNRYQTQQGNIFSRLSSLANLGENAAANQGAQGTALVGQAGQAVQNAGTATGAGYVGAANALSGGVGDYMGAKYLGMV